MLAFQLRTIQDNCYMSFHGVGKCLFIFISVDFRKDITFFLSNIEDLYFCCQSITEWLDNEKTNVKKSTLVIMEIQEGNNSA